MMEWMRFYFFQIRTYWVTLTKGFTFHARPQTGAYSCLKLKLSSRELRKMKKKLSKTDLSFKFCKIGLKNTLFIFGRKNGRLLLLFVVVVVCCNFVRFWLTFFLIEAFIELRKMLSRKKLYHARFGNCSTPKVPRFCRFNKFTKMQST